MRFEGKKNLKKFEILLHQHNTNMMSNWTSNQISMSLGGCLAITSTPHDSNTCKLNGII